MTPEHSVQNQIRLAISEYGVFFRINVGKGLTYDGRHFETGVPEGFSDLFGVRNDGRAVFIEVKSETGKLRPKQKSFLEEMKKHGAIAGVARSPEDAVKIIKEEI